VGDGVSWCGTGRRRRRPRPAAAVERDEAEADLQWVAAQGERVDADDQWRGGHPVAGAEDDPARQDVVVACRVIEERVTRSLSSSEPVSRFAKKRTVGCSIPMHIGAVAAELPGGSRSEAWSSGAPTRNGSFARQQGGSASEVPCARCLGIAPGAGTQFAGSSHGMNVLEVGLDAQSPSPGSAAAAPAGSESAVTATTVESAPGAEAGARSTAVLRFAGRSTSAD
jgi:hypothetical protein